MNKIVLSIGGMSCSACSSSLEKYLNKQKGIKSASVNLVLAQALIEYEDYLTLNDLERFVKESGYESLGEYNEKEETNNKKPFILLIFFGFLALVLMYIAMSHMIGLPVIPFLDMVNHPFNYAITLCVLTVPFLLYGLDIFKNGIKNLLHKSPNMDTLVSLGVASSFLYSVFSLIMIINGNNMYVENLYFESCAMIIFFIKLGRFIDINSKEKTKEAIKELVTITPSKALIKTNDGEKEVTIDEVKVGDILISKPGMKIAVDGEIVFGETHLDEAFITGESTPVKKSIKDKVIAGSINYDGYIEYQAVKIGKDSTISEIVRLVVEATNTKAPIARLADKVSGYFVPTIMVIAFITFIAYMLLGYSFSQSLSTFVTILVVACPCALGLATPLAIVISEGICAKKGILVKKSETLENAHKVDTIVFDKTGTLTYGNLKVSKIYNYSDYKEKDLMQIVASIEAKSTHPIGLSLMNYAQEKNLTLSEVSSFKNLPGIGVEGKINQKKFSIGNNKLFKKLKIDNEVLLDEENLSKTGNSIVYVIEDRKVIGLIGIKDVIRNSAIETIKRLQQMHKEVIMLTGDNENTAHIIAESIGIKKVIANVLPTEKIQVIKDILDNGNLVMMVGDGINDAPSLALATIGVSINSGTDIAGNSSDVILINDNLLDIPNLLDISKKTIRNIKQNLFWAFFYNICMVPLAIGLLRPFNLTMNPMIAGLAMTISSLTVVFNALRLKRWKEKSI